MPEEVVNMTAYRGVWSHHSLTKQSKQATLLGGLPASLAQPNQVYHLSQTRVVFQVDG